MNTPAHILVNLAVLGGGERWAYARPIAAGAVLCDLPMFLFFVWERFVEGASQAAIWGHAYFESGWQRFFDVFNSIPLALLGLLGALAGRRPGVALFFASVLLHSVLDLPLHHDDGHGHFWPISTWRFVSPVSYWDPAHHGAWGALLETSAVVVSCAVLWQRVERVWLRAALAALGSVQSLGWLLLYVVR